MYEAVTCRQIRCEWVTVVLEQCEWLTWPEEAFAGTEVECEAVTCRQIKCEWVTVVLRQYEWLTWAEEAQTVNYNCRLNINPDIDAY